jgi:hypothetical protein
MSNRDKNGRFLTCGNPSGRPKGSKNQFSKSFKEQIRKAIGKHMGNLHEDFDKLSPNERVKAIALLSKFVIAEKKNVQMKSDMKIEVSYTDELQENKVENIEDNNENV